MRNTGTNRLRCALTGGAAGVINGLLGGGGGLALVPLLSRWCEVSRRRAFATSLAVTLPLSAFSLLVYALRGRLDLWAALPYLLGGSIGGFAGGRLFRKVPLPWLRRAFGLLMVYGGVRALL